MIEASEKPTLSTLFCDGCGQPSAPGHIAARIARLEWATQFRPIHIQALFVYEAPQATTVQSAGVTRDSAAGGADSTQENAASFPPSAIQDYGALLDGLQITGLDAQRDQPASEGENFLVRLNEFQRRGFYLAFLVECPLESATNAVSSREESPKESVERCARFGPTLIKRIKYSYRPKRIVLLSGGLRPLVEMIEKAELDQSLILDDGNPFELPRSSDIAARDFQSAWQSAWERSQAAVSALGP